MPGLVRRAPNTRALLVLYQVRLDIATELLIVPELPQSRRGRLRRVETAPRAGPWDSEALLEDQETPLNRPVGSVEMLLAVLLPVGHGGEPLGTTEPAELGEAVSPLPVFPATVKDVPLALTR